jgi:hypothetical protein
VIIDVQIPNEKKQNIKIEYLMLSTYLRKREKKNV